MDEHNKMRKLYVDRLLGIDKDKILLAGDFINFCADRLPIKGGFEIHIVSDREANQIETTAAYHRGKNLIKVYGKNRALVDILRSVAHEMTHLMQDENGELQGIIQDAGGHIEDEANAKAGEVIKLFAKSLPRRRAIYEAAAMRIGELLV
tara:strand:+ start:253 stop:702 length:450 start_codon:yes stop_codon:yes gene_type:complete